MKKRSMTEFPIDNSSILFLSLVKKHHTNSYRFTMELTEDVDPAILQQAVDAVYRRFPSIIAGFRPDFLCHTQVAASQPPQVQPDPGVLLTMTAQELERCAYRVLYAGNTISIEAFHALTDGYGAIASFSTLVAEYLRRKHGALLPEAMPLLPLAEAPKPEEVADGYLQNQGDQPLHLPSRYAYLLPAKPKDAWRVLPTSKTYPLQAVLAAARRHGVSVTALITGVMADAIMEIQHKIPSGRKKPVRIMVPADLRRIFGGKTLRNFVLYALPTLEPQEAGRPIRETLSSFHRQLKEQLAPERLRNIAAYNVRTQASLLFRAVPRVVKYGFMRLAYRFFGESNSSLTLTNLGSVKLPEEMRPYVRHMECMLTPRVTSPYNCAILSYADKITINVTRFSPKSELEALFFGKLEALMAQP